MNDALIPMINDTYDAMYAELENNNDGEYERLDRVVNGLLIAYTDGDQHYAAALRNLWSDSQEHLEWYLKMFSRDAAVLEWSGTLTRDEYNALSDKLYGAVCPECAVAVSAYNASSVNDAGRLVCDSCVKCAHDVELARPCNECVKEVESLY